MNKFLTVCMVVLVSVTSDAAAIPNGFVYRGRMAGSANAMPSPDKMYALELRLYKMRGDDTALWTGTTQISPGTNGLFQVWVSDAIRDKSCDKNLSEVIGNGTAAYVGVAFDGGSECLPRRRVLFAPAVEEAERAGDVIAGGRVGNLIVTNGVLEVRQLNAAKTAINRITNTKPSGQGSGKIYFDAEKLLVLGEPFEVTAYNAVMERSYLEPDREYILKNKETGAEVKRAGFLLLFTGQYNGYDMKCCTLPINSNGILQVPMRTDVAKLIFFPFGTDN